MCRNGQYTERGIKEIDGFMSERWRIEPGYFTKLDPSLGILGVLLEPATVVAKAWEHGRRHAGAGVLGASHPSWSPAPARSACSPRSSACSTASTSTCSTGSPRARSRDWSRDLGATYHAGSVADIGFEPDVIIECTGVGPVIVDSIRQVGAGGVVCLTGVGQRRPDQRAGGGRRRQRAGPAEQRRSSARSTPTGGTSTAPPRRSPPPTGTGSHGLITRRVPPDDVGEALTRGPDDIKVVVDFEG